MTAHTPAPWYANPQCRIAHQVPVVGGNTELIALVQTVVRPGGVDAEAQEANARLLAAAPELADMLRRVTDAARALLTEAAGYDASWSVPQFLEDEPAVNALRAALAQADAVRERAT